MHRSTFLSAFMLLVTSVTAEGILSIAGNATVGSPTDVFLQALNGLTTDPPKCSGYDEVSPLPTSGTIPCVDGYALSWTWNDKTEGIAANFTTPTSSGPSSFTYAVPNLGCDGDICQFGFTDIFP